MFCNLKSLGLTIAAVMAMSAVMASTASATPQFTASAYPATVTGSNTKGSEVLTTEGGKVECDSHFVSHSLAAASSTLTVTPTYTECTAFGLGATVNTEGCAYILHATAKDFVTTHTHHFDVTCPTGKSIKIIAGGGLCRMEIKGQTGLTGVDTHLSFRSIRTVFTLAGVFYTVTTDSFGCPFNGTGNKSGGEYTGEVTVSRVGGGSVEVSGE